MYEVLSDPALVAEPSKLDDTDQPFVLVVDGRPVAQLVVRMRPSAPPELRGDLAPSEASIVGLDLPWDADWREAGTVLLAAALRRIDLRDATVVQIRLNPEVHDHVDRRRDVLQRAGFELFSEKEGYEWRPGDTPDDGDRPARATLRELGDEHFADVIAACGQDTLDRNDRWYRAQCGPTNWGRVFVTMHGPADLDSWVVALDGGEEVGFVAVSGLRVDRPNAWDVPPVGTIVLVGVLPHHRGRGHVDRLLRLAHDLARERGFASLVDSVDVDNRPMAAAMARNGHDPHARPSHDWVYRYPVGAARSSHREGSERG